MRRTWLYLSLLWLLFVAVPLEAQFGWFTQDGGLIARMSSAAAAATIQQFGTGKILSLKDGNTEVWSVADGGAQSLYKSGIAATSTDGQIIENSTASTSGVPVQQSPRLRFRSHVWNTTATAATNTDDWLIESVPVSGTTPSGLLKFGSSLNGAAYSFPMTIDSAGTLTVIGNITSSGAGVQMATGGNLSFGNQGLLNTTANGLFAFRNAAGTNTFNVTLADWGTTLSGESVSLAADTATTISATAEGYLFVTNQTDGTSCLFVLSGNAAAEINDPASACSVAAATDNNINVYWDAGDARYEIINTFATTKAVRLVLIGS